MGKEGLVETHVDKLMKLLAERKYISIEQAAKELGVGPDIVEEWSRFLEEDNLLKIKYQLTKPYLQAVEGKEVVLKSDGTKQRIVETDEVETKMSASKPEHVSELLEQTKVHLESQEFAKGKASYHTLQKAFNSLPHAYLTKKKELEQQLISMHQKFSNVLDEEHSVNLNREQKTIHALLKDGRRALRAAQLDKAIQTYNLIKKHYLSLPPGHFDTRAQITEHILEFYQALSLQQHKNLTTHMQSKTDEIHSTLGEVHQHLARGDVDSAHSKYDSVKDIYASMPSGFLEEKIELQQRMLQTYKTVIDNKRDKSVTEIQKKTLEVNALLHDIDAHVRNHQLDAAVEKYQRVKQLYSTIPKGFLSNEALVQANILQSYRSLVRAQQLDSRDAIKFGKAQIEKDLKSMDNYIMQHNLDLAFEHYKQSIDRYNLLPAGFDNDKMTLRNQIYQRYHSIISKSDVASIGDLEPYVQLKYNKLLTLLVTAHKVIDSQEFGLLKDLYMNIYTSYNELPLHIVRQKTMIRMEVQNIHQMYRLYDAVAELDRLSQQNRLQELKHGLKDVEHRINEAENNNPADKQIISYAKARHQQYAKFLLHQSIHNVAEPQTSLAGPPVMSPPPLEMSNSPDLIHDREDIIRSLIQTKRQKAMSELSLNNYKAAIPHLRTWLDLDPQNMEARYLLESAQLQLRR